MPAAGLSLDEAFNRQAKGLSPRDRAFAWRLARTAMRYHGPLLHLMTEVLERGRSGVNKELKQLQEDIVSAVASMPRSR